MRLAPTLLVLACWALGACPAPSSTTHGRAATTSSADVTDAGDSGAGNDGSATVADPLAIFLEAARTDLEGPYPRGVRASNRRYFEASELLPGHERRPPMPAEQLVATVLGQSEDPRAAPALATWARLPEARPRLSILLEAMTWRPAPVYLETVQAILADPDLAGELQHTYGTSFSLALGIEAYGSLYAQALDLAAALTGGAGRALVERIAADRGASEPDPRTLAAFKCAKGQTRIEAEARALASLRLMALAALGDRARWAKVADDPSEPALVRTWTRRLARGNVSKDSAGGAQRMNWRERHAEQEIWWSSVRDRDFMPCAGKFPGERRDLPREPLW